MSRSPRPDDLDHIASMLRAVAEPTRLRILKSLEVGELCAVQVVDLVGLSQPTVSRHLAVLVAAGLVTARKEGRWTFYRTAFEATGFRRRLLALLDTWGGGDETITGDWRHAEELRRTAPVVSRRS